MRVYIAGPYTKGDVCQNVRAAILAADRVAEAGHTPFITHMSHFWHMLCPHEYEFWMEQDLAWLYMCQALICLPGESKGADLEVQEARRIGIPVYESVEAFLVAQTEV